MEAAQKNGGIVVEEEIKEDLDLDLELKTTPE
jgi:hypothetical protein